MATTIFVHGSSLCNDHLHAVCSNMSGIRTRWRKIDDRGAPVRMPVDENASAKDDDDHDLWNKDVTSNDLVARNGYRYIPLKNGDNFEEDWPVNNSVSLSPHDRSVDVKILFKGRLLRNSDEKLGGYRSAMATHGLSPGATAFFEVMIGGSHWAGNVRIGVGRLQAHMGGPIGMDKYGYCLTDSGHIVHDAYKRVLSGCRLEEESIIGVLIHLPECGSRSKRKSYSEVVPFEHLGKRFLQCKIKNCPKDYVLAGSFIKFYVNGRDLGEAFTDIPVDTYFPFCSVFRGGNALVNFGPEFFHSPSDSLAYVPWCSLKKSNV